MAIALAGKPLKYQTIQDELRRHVAGLPGGAKLPSERDLASAFGCSALTVRKSLANLADHGLIERRAGSGTFVAEPVSTAPPPRARRATGKGAQQVGLLICPDTDAYGQQVLQALGRVAQREQVTLQSAWMHNLEQDALDQAAGLAAAGCQAIAMPWFPLDRRGEVGELIRRSPLPISVPELITGYERHCFEAPALFGTSTLRATEATCRYLRALGHERIALLGPNAPRNPILQAKLSAYSCYVSSAGLPHLCGLVGEASADLDALAQQWREYRGALAVVSYDDTLAMRLVTAMHKLGLAAPADFAIVGFNNLDASRFCDPPLSTLCQDFDYIATWLLRSAVGLARGTVCQSTQSPPHRLVVRQTCGGAGRLTPALLAAVQPCGIAPVLETVPAAPVALALAALS